MLFDNHFVFIFSVMIFSLVFFLIEICSVFKKNENLKTRLDTVRHWQIRRNWQEKETVRHWQRTRLDVQIAV